jgi:outer membrane lipoprotein SlyB
MSISHPIHRYSRAALIALGLTLGACASTSGGAPPGASSSSAAWTGTVQSIQETQSSPGWASMTGGIVGTVVGAVLGSGIGAGVGKTIASVVVSGVAGVGGQKVGSVLASSSAWDVAIRGSDGVDRTVRVAQKPGFAPGANVQVGADGSISAR